MNACSGVRFSRPARLFSLGLLDGTTPRPRLLTLVKRLYRELHTLA